MIGLSSLRSAESVLVRMLSSNWLISAALALAPVIGVVVCAVANASMAAWMLRMSRSASCTDRRSSCVSFALPAARCSINALRA